MTTTLQKPSLNNLATLASQINEHHAECVGAAHTALEHARQAGDLLNEAKALCTHGDWQAWLADNFVGSERTAQVYQRVAKHWPEIESKAQGTADLTLENAVELIAKKHETTASDREDDNEPLCKSVFDLSVEDRAHSCKHWWDLLAMWVLLFDAAGWEPKRIAEFLGVDETEDVMPILEPRPPMRGGEGNGSVFYRDLVTMRICFLLGDRCQSAVWAAEREKMTEAIPKLKYAHEHFERRWHRLSDSDTEFVTACGATDAWPVRQCAWDDARVALGTENNEKRIKKIKGVLAFRVMAYGITMKEKQSRLQETVA